MILVFQRAWMIPMRSPEPVQLPVSRTVVVVGAGLLGACLRTYHRTSWERRGL